MIETSQHDQTGAASQALVAILMCTKDGSAFLDEQLESVAAQKYPHIDIWVSDDGSVDATLQILRAWRDKWSKGRFEILAGPRRGFAENFRSLVCNSAIEADYYGFSDQDDIWEPEKLATAIEQMSVLGPSRAQMFCSSTLTIASNGQVIGRSPMFSRPPTFRNALVQSIAGANTMVFNRAARDLVALASIRSGFVSHDWWAYLILTGCGGTVHYSDSPLVRYRQHSSNAVGQNNSFTARLDRFRRLFNGAFTDWISANLRGLSINRDLLTQEECKRFDLFSGARNSGPIARLRKLYASGIYRQSRLGTATLFLAAVIGKL